MVDWVGQNGDCPLSQWCDQGLPDELYGSAWLPLYWAQLRGVVVFWLSGRVVVLVVVLVVVMLLLLIFAWLWLLRCLESAPLPLAPVSPSLRSVVVKVVVVGVVLSVLVVV